MTARGTLARARQAGISVYLRPNGKVRAEPPPPPDLLAALRAHRDAIAAQLRAEAKCTDIPTCRNCGGRRFWRATTSGAVGDWSCVRVSVPSAVQLIDILGPIEGEARIVVCAFPAEVEQDALGRTLAKFGTYVALGRVKPRWCR